MEVEDTGGDGACHGGCQCGRNPDARILHDVAHLQHGGAEPLCHEAAPLILLKAHNSESDHLGTAACHCGSAGQAGEREGSADGCGGDGKRECDSHDDGNQDAHEEGLQLCGPHDGFSDGRSRIADGRRKQHGQHGAHDDGDGGRYQDVHSGLLGDSLAAFRCHDGDEQNCQRASGTAQRVGCDTHACQREEDERRRLQGVTDGDGHGRSGGGACISSDVLKNLDAQLFSQGGNDGSDKERREQTLCHGGQCVDAVPLRAELDILSLEEGGKAGLLSCICIIIHKDTSVKMRNSSAWPQQFCIGNLTEHKGHNISMAVYSCKSIK